MEAQVIQKVGWLEYWDGVRTQLQQEHHITLGGQHEVYHDWKSGKTIDESVLEFLKD